MWFRQLCYLHRTHFRPWQPIIESVGVGIGGRQEQGPLEGSSIRARHRLDGVRGIVVEGVWRR